MQEPAKGVTPGGTIDLAGAGVRIGRHSGVGGVRQAGGVMEDEEMEEAERAERDAALAELLGGGPVAAPPAPPAGEGPVRFNLNETGGFLR